VRIIEDLQIAEISLPQVIKVDSNTASVTPRALLENISLKDQPCIYIFCEASLLKIYHDTSPEAKRFHESALMMVDESHLQEGLMLEILSKKQHPYSLIAGLSASPKIIKNISNRKEDFLLEYDRQDAVLTRNLSPCILDRFNCDYHNDVILNLIDNMAHFLNSHIAPRGEALIKQKGIIYVPNNAQEINYSQRLHDALEKSGIKSHQINSIKYQESQKS
jgi:hypothetical protein